MKSVKKVVLAYSGGLDTSIIVPWLIENYNCEVIAMVADLGQAEELEGLEKKAKASGASKCYIEDLREEFILDFAFPTLKAGAIYEGLYLLGTSTARPLISKRQVEIALEEDADAVAHGATGKGNDQVRFELAYKALAPQLTIIAPWKQWDIRSREDALEYAARKGIPVAQSKEKIYSRDRNIWHMSHEGGILENPWEEPPEDVYVITASPEKAPDKPDYITVEFEKGNPMGFNDSTYPPVTLLEELNRIAGKHGVGRVDMVENRLVGMKSRGVYETPGGTVLYIALTALESLVLDRETVHYKRLIAEKYAELVYYGKWFSTLREAFDVFVNEVMKNVTGKVRLKLFKGKCSVVGITSPYSLYREDLATFSEDDIYNQKDAEGFINLFGLPEKVTALLNLSKNK